MDEQDIINLNNKKQHLEYEIQQLKLNMYKKQFELSEIKNVIRKNCLHEWSKNNDIETGNNNCYEIRCVNCGLISGFE